MKKSFIVTILIFFCISSAYSTIITNTNQSAIYVRLLARNASMDIDAVFYNPAGVTKLKNGWHLALHNQTIFQEKKVVNDFYFLNDDTYIGDVDVPVFPNFYLVYKKDKLALSFGFGPNSGGGTAKFMTGLPSFEIPIASIPLMLTMMGLPTSAYSADIAFEGKSIYFGFQFNLSYAVSDTISLAAGVRYIQAKTTYDGNIRNIAVNPYHPLINPTAQMIPAAQFFTVIGQPALAAQVRDMSVDVEQTGTGFTPILGLHFTPVEKLNIGIRYEFNTKLELENNTTVDDVGLFPDGYKFRNDIPAILSLGMEYAASKDFRVMVSFNTYFDKNANWDGAEKDVEDNSYDLALGIEQDLADWVLISLGYMRTQVGVTADYQSDFAHELSSDAFALGGRLMVFKNMDIDLGFLYVTYSSNKKTILTILGATNETYQRKSLAFTIGLGYHF